MLRRRRSSSRRNRPWKSLPRRSPHSRMKALPCLARPTIRGRPWMRTCTTREQPRTRCVRCGEPGKRGMNIHEYQAKDVLRGFDVPVPRGRPAFSVDEAVRCAEALGGTAWVVKAQIHAGGRGKGGGVKLVRSLDDVRSEAQRMLGMTLVTKQTGPHGRVVHRLYVEEASDIARELYLSALVDRAIGRIAFIASIAGGMDIEDVARASPEKIATFHVDPAAGYSAFIGRNIAHALGLEGEQARQAVALVEQLYAAYVAKDMSLLEINPLVVTKDGRVVCLDAKIVFDDNALFRHADVQNLRDPDEEDPSERAAARYDLSYIKLAASIGCMVNG